MGPLTAHELAMPAQDGLGADHQDSTPPQAARLGRGRFERRGQTDQEDFVRVADAWRACRPSERLQLVAQEQDLEILGALRTAAQDEALQDEGDDPDEQAVHGVGTSGPTDRVPRAYHPQIHLAGTLCAVFALYALSSACTVRPWRRGIRAAVPALDGLGRGVSGVRVQQAQHQEGKNRGAPARHPAGGPLTHYTPQAPRRGSAPARSLPPQPSATRAAIGAPRGWTTRPIL